MNDEPKDRNEGCGEQPHAGSLPDAGALNVTGPTARQELFLKRQHLWHDDLTREQASELIEGFLTKKHAERRPQQQAGGRTVSDDGPCE